MHRRHNLQMPCLLSSQPADASNTKLVKNDDST
jgi:hypothetical protein